MDAQTILAGAKILCPPDIFINKNLPNNWRVWFLGQKLIMIASGDRVVFDTDEQYPLPESPIVISGKHCAHGEFLFAAMGGTHGAH